MSYRDESETLRARIETLEEELRTANRTIARLQGDVPAADAPGALQSSKSTWIFGAPARLVLRRELPSEPHENAFPAIAALLHQRIGRFGQLSQVGRSLAYRHRAVELTILPQDGSTHVQIVSDNRGLMILPFSFACAFFGPAFAFALALSWPVPWFAILAVSMVLGLITTRLTIGAWIRYHHRKLRGAVEAVASLIAAAPRAQVRVAAAPPLDAAVEDDEEAVPAPKQLHRA